MATVMTDDQIRLKIKEYNITNVPLTDSTRNILIQLIKKRSEEAKSPGRPSSASVKKSRKTFSHFSSGEDTSEDENKTSEKNKMPPPSSSQRGTRRQTIGVGSENLISPTSKSRHSELMRNEPISPTPEPEPKKRSGRFSLQSESSRPSPRNSSPLINRSNAALRRTASRNADEYDEGSDSDVPVAKVLSGLRETREKKTAPVGLDDIHNKMNASKFMSRLSPFKSRSEQNGSGNDANNVSVDSLMSFRKSPQLPMSEPKKRLSGESSPFQSSFLRKIAGEPSWESRPFGSPSLRTSDLYKFRDRIGGDGDSLNSTISSTQSGSPQNGHFPRSSGSRSILSREFKTATDYDEPHVWLNTNMKSMIVVSSAIVFFLVLAVVYVYVVRTDVDNFSAESKRNSFPLCDTAEDKTRPCVTKDQLQAATSLIRYLYPELKRRAIQSVCGPPERDGSYVSPVMTDTMMVNYLHDVHQMAEWKVGPSLRNLKVLAMSNPHWGFSVVNPRPRDADGDAESSVEDVRKLIEQGGLVATDVQLPTWCYVRQKVMLVLMAVIAILAGVLSIFVSQRSVRWYMERRRRANDEVFALVQRIIGLLQSHHAAALPGEQSYVAINHVRDELIPPNQRDSMSGVWQKAVHFIEHNESRVRREVQCVTGEECPVWRWLPSASLLNASGGSASSSPSSSPLPNSISLSASDAHPNRTKVWQGQAFVTEPGAQNGAPRSPTPCLKVRHMFDDSEYGDDWAQKVQDAILEKCGDGATVLHMVVDETSSEGLVYIKLATKEDAGVAYRALHGWWFDTKLVTVKYIRLERYHERFPSSVNASVPLKPSNDKKLSLSNIMGLTPLETN